MSAARKVETPEPGFVRDPLKLRFARTLDRISGQRNCVEVFRAFCLMAAANMALKPELSQAEEDRWTPEEVALFGQAFGELVQEMETRPYLDLLGPVYMEIAHRLDRDSRGEFFTPTPICRLMGQMSLEDMTWPEDRPASVWEPACGAGAMVLGLVHAMVDRGISPLHVQVVAQDLSETSAHMAYLNLTLWGIPATVRCGNTIIDDYRWTWTNPLWSLATPYRPKAEVPSKPDLAAALKRLLGDIDQIAQVHAETPPVRPRKYLRIKPKKESAA